MIRNETKKRRENLKRRENTENLKDFDELVKLDEEWRKLTTELQDRQEKRNKITEQISKKKQEGKDAKEEMKKAKEISKRVDELKEKRDKIWKKFHKLHMKIPNILHESVPKGKDDTENKTIREWGEVPDFGFDPKNHVEIAENLGIADFDKSGEVSGSGFYYLKKDLALLDMALIQFTIDQLKDEFQFIIPPYMIRRKPYEGVTGFEAFKDMMYKIEDYDLYPIATSEHSIAAMKMNEVINENNLPLKLMGFSPCFRKEIGSHGVETKGIFRVHQFHKIEQFVFSRPKDSWDIFEQLIENAENLYKKLKIPYEVKNICTGDMGVVASKKYDIEAWIPSTNSYKEVVSCSNCLGYQARRLNIKFREKEGQKPKGYVHTLNSTAIATGRTMVAILENYQTKDGKVKIPKVLRDYMGKEVIG